MNTTQQKPKFIAIKNWSKYQCKDRHGRHIRLYIKDYCAKDVDDLQYSRLTVTQRYYMDALCRLRGRLGRNIPNDVKFISRALSILPQERHNLSAIVEKLVGCLCANGELLVGSLCAACKLLVGCGFLVLTNEEVDSSDSDSDTESDTKSDTDTEKSVSTSVSEQGGQGESKATPTPVIVKAQPESASPELVTLSRTLAAEIALALFHPLATSEPVTALLQAGTPEDDIRKAIKFLSKSDYWGKNGSGELPDTAAFCRAFPAILKARNNYYSKAKSVTAVVKGVSA